MFPSTFSEEIFYTKYAGNTSSYPEFARRLAQILSLGNHGDAHRFEQLLLTFKFIPGGRIMAFGGRPDAKMSLLNCTTHAVTDDSLESISETVFTIMRASSRGQGIGVDLSALRPRGAVVNNAARTSTGAISFMELFNSVGSTIGQDGRRAALLFSLSVHHPDIWRPGEKDILCPKCNGKGCMKCKGEGYLPYDFLHVKSIPGKVENANISVFITDDFMQAVKENRPFDLTFTVNSSARQETICRTVSAKALFMELARCAWQSAEPGLLFKDTIARSSNSDLFGDAWKIVGTNACSEEPLDQDGVCNLGSINLGKYVLNPFTKQARFDYAEFANDVETAVRILDNALTVELERGSSISEHQRASIENLRRIGLGVMGYADCLAMLGLPYKVTPETLTFTESLFAALRDAAYEASIALAVERGAFPLLASLSEQERRELIQKGFYASLPDDIREKIVHYGMRNVTVLSIAPTGSISNFAGASSGIEPLFALEYVRRVRMNGGDEFIRYVHPVVEHSRSLGLPDTIWQTTYEVTPLEHVIIQATIQKYIDAAISKTINLPAEASIQDVADVYMKAWELGLKGVTVYRGGSRDQAVLYNPAEENCPVCNTPLVRESGCATCPSCGYGRCE